MSTATGADSNINIRHVLPVMQTERNRQKKTQKEVLWDANLKGQITAYLRNVHQI